MEKKKQQIEIATIAKELCFSDDKERELLQNRSIKQLIEGFIIEKNAKNKAYYCCVNLKLTDKVFSVLSVLGRL